MSDDNKPVKCLHCHILNSLNEWTKVHLGVDLEDESGALQMDRLKTEQLGGIAMSTSKVLGQLVGSIEWKFAPQLYTDTSEAKNKAMELRMGEANMTAAFGSPTLMAAALKRLRDYKDTKPVKH